MAAPKRPSASRRRDAATPDLTVRRQSTWPYRRMRSALARFEAALGLVDDVDPALAADDAVVAVTAAQRLERIADFHGDLGPRPARQFSLFWRISLSANRWPLRRDTRLRKSCADHKDRA